MKMAWVVIGNTESGDKFSYVFDFMPSDNAIEAFLYNKMPHEFESVGFVHWSLFHQDIINSDDLPTEIYESYAKFKNTL